MLDIARIESVRIELSPEVVSVSALCNEAAPLIQPLAAERNVRVGRCVGKAGADAVRADRQRLSQVVLNLLSNAAKYNRAGGTVTISREPGTRADRLRLTVTDTGPGIPPANLEKLFTPFERLGAEHGGVESTGIGLALSKRLAEAMDGFIGVETTVGRSSAFYLELPLASGSAAMGEPSLDAPLPASLFVAGPTVLCVEDNLSNYALDEQTLEVMRANIRLLGARRGQLGLDMAREHRPDLILWDLQLPDAPGDEWLRQLKADEQLREIPAIMIMVDAAKGQGERLLGLGARAYLTKPLHIPAFLQSVDEALDRARR